MANRSGPLQGIPLPGEPVHCTVTGEDCGMRCPNYKDSYRASAMSPRRAERARESEKEMRDAVREYMLTTTPDPYDDGQMGEILWNHQADRMRRAKALEAQTGGKFSPERCDVLKRYQL